MRSIQNIYKCIFYTPNGNMNKTCKDEKRLGLILLPIVAALFVVLFPFLVIIAYINYKLGENNE